MDPRDLISKYATKKKLHEGKKKFGYGRAAKTGALAGGAVGVGASGFAGAIIGGRKHWFPIAAGVAPGAVARGVIRGGIYGLAGYAAYRAGRAIKRKIFNRKKTNKEGYEDYEGLKCRVKRKLKSKMKDMRGY